jgi:hypothetical protein
LVYVSPSRPNPHPSWHPRGFRATPSQLTKELDLDAEVLELAWEEASSTSVGASEAAPGSSSTSSTSSTSTSAIGHAIVTPDSFLELVHSRPSAGPGESYRVWRLLSTDLGHVFFKDIADHGRITAFRAKGKPAVEAAKSAFCEDHEQEKEWGFCFVK